MSSPLIRMPKVRKVTHDIELVTVEKAERWLTQNNTHNRPLSDAKVREYASDMSSGRWRFNGETIQFDANGLLLNGQHRLWAIIESGRPQTFLIVRGVEAESQLTMDQGTRRSPSDQLAIAGINADTRVAAAVRVYIQWQTGRLFGDQKVKVNTSEIVEWAQQHPDEMRLLGQFAEMNLVRIKVPPSITYAVALILWKVDSEAAQEFIEQVASGTGNGVDERSPAYVLRERFIRAKTSDTKLSPRDVVGMYFTAWNAYRGGRKITKLQRPLGGAYTVDNFPQPV